MFQRESNAVFAQLPAQAAKAMRARGWKFYEFIGAGGCRLMCAWDTQPLKRSARCDARIRELCCARKDSSAVQAGKPGSREAGESV